jgi:PAS domain S-box-containing protein
MTKENPSNELGRSVTGRMGVLPNFFQLVPETPEITEKLWGFAQVAYLDNPLPSVFKERLFVHLSRFCIVRYCIARHVGFLVGLGFTAGDKDAQSHSIVEIVKLLRRPIPRGAEIKPYFALCDAQEAPLAELPNRDSQIEEAVFALAAHVFLQTTDASECRESLTRLFGPIRFQYLLLFLTFVRAAHYWTRVHPEIQFEDDINQLLQTHQALADCILNDPAATADSVSQSILDELPLLREKAGAALNLMAAIVEGSDDAIVSKTLDGVITTWNSGAERIFGYTAKDAIGQNISLIIPAERAAEERSILDKIGRGERISHFDTVRVRKDGARLDVALTISPVRDSANKIIGASKVARDVTQRKRMERALRDSEDQYRMLADALETQVQFRTQELNRRNVEILAQAEQLRDLSTRLMAAQDEERRHVARELHDSAGQIVASLSMDLERIDIESKTGATVLPASIKTAKTRLQELSSEIRTTSYLLHPPLLDEMGLPAAVRWYIEGLTERSRIEINLTISENLQRLEPNVEVTIFRLIQECMTNIHRHSGSKQAHIRVAREGDKIVVDVRDEGKGMSPHRTAEVQSRGGVGITGMRERLRQLHGELVIESGPQGTRVLATFPYAKGTSATTGYDAR